MLAPPEEGSAIPAPDPHDDALPPIGGDRSVPPWLKLLGAVSLLGLLATAVTYVVPDGHWTESVRIALDPPALLFAIAALLFARSRSRGTMRAVFGLFALGVGAWLAGNVVYDVRFGAGQAPDSSIADVFYLLYYPPVLLGLYLLDRASRRGSALAGNTLDTVIVTLAAGLLLWVLVRHSDLTAEGDTVTKILGVTYAALDLGVLWMLLIPVLRGDVVWSWSRALMSASFLAILVADIFWIGTHFDLYDLVAAVALTVLGVSALLPQATPDPEQRHTRRSDLAADMAAVVVGVAAIALLASLALRHGVEADLAVATSVLLGLVMARLVLAVLAAERLRREAERRANVDPLTGLLNHGAFEESLEREISRARRVGEPVGLLIIDIDRFKDVNDLAGHRTGDRVLVDVANLIRATVRQSDLTCRTGGDEMAVIAPSTGLDAAGELAARLVGAVHGIRLTSGGVQTHLSVSIGVSALPDPAPTGRELTDQADAALYAAKDGGRDRWVTFGSGGRGRDDDERRAARTAAQLGARDADFRAVFTHALEPMVIVDSSTTMLEVNESAARTAGVSREELIGRRLTEFVSTEARATMAKLVADLPDAARQAGVMPVTIDGREMVLEYATSRFSPDRYLVGMHDITERDRARRMLEFSEARFRALFDSAPDAMFITDDDGVVLDANPAATELVARPRSELVDRPIEDVIPAEGRADAIAGRVILDRDGVLRGAHEGVDAAGVFRSVEFSAVAHFVAGQTLTIVHDVTDRVVAERDQDPLLSARRDPEDAPGASPSGDA